MIHPLNLRYDIGIPILRPEVKQSTKIKYKVKYKIKREKEIVHTKSEVRKHIVDAGFVNFVTDKFTLHHKHQIYLKELGSYLAKQSNTWDEILIIGHTDKRGSKEYNQILSKNRALSVAKVLVGQGVHPRRIKMEWVHFSEPAENSNSSAALARNRRTEITVVGKEGVRKIKNDVSRIMQRHKMPVTCITANRCH